MRERPRSSIIRYMETLRILLAVEQSFHREAVELSLLPLVPPVEMVCIEPEDIEPEALRFAPHLIICSRTTAVARSGELAWVQLSPSGRWLASVRLGASLTERSFFSGSGLSELVPMVGYLAGLIAQKPLTRPG